MTDIAALIARLRDTDNRFTSAVCPELREEAAAALEEQQAEIAEGHAEFKALCEHNSGLLKQWEQMKAERDALRTDQLAKAATIARILIERDALYRFARLNGLMAIDIQNAIDAALGVKP